MTRTPKISVIIPHLNQHEHLRNCLVSLSAQTYDMGCVEIIVVDNGSKEMPVKVCAEFNVRLEHEPEPGPGPARNLGVGVSCAPVLAFIDADCLADENWLSIIDATLVEAGGVDIIGGDVRIAYTDPHQLTMLEAYESIYAYRQKNYIEKQKFSGTGNLSIRRPVYDAVGPFAGIEIAEDRDWGHRATRQGHSIAYVADMIVFHPARNSFAELCTKWDRQLSHDFEELPIGIKGLLGWFAKAVAMAFSPLYEIGRIISSPRVATLKDRLSALGILSRIRWYRARRMLALIFEGRQSAKSGEWNRG